MKVGGGAWTPQECRSFCVRWSILCVTYSRRQIGLAVKCVTWETSLEVRLLSGADWIQGSLDTVDTEECEVELSVRTSEQVNE